VVGVWLFVGYRSKRLLFFWRILCRKRCNVAHAACWGTTGSIFRPPRQRMTVDPVRSVASFPSAARNTHRRPPPREHRRRSRRTHTHSRYENNDPTEHPSYTKRDFFSCTILHMSSFWSYYRLYSLIYCIIQVFIIIADCGVEVPLKFRNNY